MIAEDFATMYVAGISHGQLVGTLDDLKTAGLCFCTEKTDEVVLLLCAR